MADTQTLSPFPDIQAPKEEKATDAYGLKYVKAIWGTHTVNILQYNQQRQRDIINRTYAEGLQSVEKYKTRRGITNTSYLNLDFSPINIIAPTVDNLVGRLSSTPYKIQCNAIDPESKSRFQKFRDSLYADMFLKDYSKPVEQMAGVSLVNKAQTLPETDEEAELHLTMNYKEDASIAMEEAFNFVLSSNMFDNSREQIIRDLVTIKRSAVQRFYDEDWNIRVERIDALDVLTPYSKYDDFRNIPYIAVIKSYTIGELVQMNRANWTEEEIYNIAKANQGRNNNPIWNWGVSYEGYYASTDFTSTRPYYNFNIQVLEFYFLGMDKEVREFKKHEVRGTKGATRKYFNTVSSDYKPKDGTSELIERHVQNLYEGKWIIGTNYIFNYGMANNIPREKINGSYSPKATLPIKIIAPGIYDMQNKSLVERMIPHEDAIKLADLAMQQLLVKMKPPGVAIDTQGIMDAVKGMGLTGGPIEITKLYEQTGNYVFSSISEDGSPINSKVITELRGGLSDAMAQLIQVYQFQRQAINEVIGFNPIVDPGIAKPDVGLGVQDNAIQATNNSLRPLFNAHLKLIELAMKDVAIMIQDCIEGDNEAFVNAIGQYSTKAIAMGKSLAMVQMGIKIELLPDDKEKADLVALMQLGIEQGLLNASDAIRIKQVMKEDVKLAAKLLVFLENKNRKDKMAESQALQQQNGQIQMQSAQATSQAQAQLDQILTNNKIMVLQKQAEFEEANAQKAFERTMALQNLKNEGANTVAEINAGGKVNVQDAANKGKIVAQQVANEGKAHEAHINHESKLHTIALEHAIAPDKKEPAKK